MTTTPVIRVGEPRELLAYVPYRLGFQPADSVVAISVRGGRQRVGLVARTGIADLADPDHGEACAGFLADRLREDGAARVVLAVYTATPRAAIRGGAVPEAAALARLRGAVGRAAVAETWVVGPSGYAELGCDDDACCPDAGRPLSDLESTVVGAHMVFAGESVAPDRRALRLRGTAPPRSRRSAGRAAAAARAEYRGLREDPGPGAPDALHAWIERLLRSWRQLWRAAERGLPLPAPALGRVLAALEVPVARDAVLTSLTAAWREDGRPVPGGNPATAVELSVRPPDPTLLRPACAVVEAVVAHAPRSRRALPLAVLAFLSWWEGDGSRANVLLEQSLECGEPEGLALLLARVLADGRPPPWVCEVGGAPQSN